MWTEDDVGDQTGRTVLVTGGNSGIGFCTAQLLRGDVAALSVVRAARDPTVGGGEFYGPDGPFGLPGRPALTCPAPRVHDHHLQRRLWAASDALTGVRYRFPDRR